MLRTSPECMLQVQRDCVTMRHLKQFEKEKEKFIRSEKQKRKKMSIKLVATFRLFEIIDNKQNIEGKNYRLCLVWLLEDGNIHSLP